MNKDQFLPQDRPAAIAEYRAVWTCIGRIEESIMKGDLKEAELTIRDLSKSVRELERLAERKQNHEQLMTFVAELKEKGILVSTVVRVR
ncbi:hypothetical protein PB1_16459 [Bacillus methanolicus PB1]|uniref:Uncharacterized protein n=1 Tax=Bacillus methanolicus PB1 TaxID=997296 RepID=I3DY46_BACMT|nr:hypothetical protein [Bacillus methanolicus]EIJ79167.1 hypothetical protein PB1_16459 [Bacillus methanolicus PB1]